jgi:hypothetical protein
MSNNSLFHLLLSSSICGVFVLSSGCWGTKENDVETRNSGTRGAPSRLVAAWPQSPNEKQSPVNDSEDSRRAAEPRVLSPANEKDPATAQLFPPSIEDYRARQCEDAKAPTMLITSESRGDDPASAPITVEPARLSGEEMSVDEDERVNPLRRGDRPAPGATRELLPKVSGAGRDPAFAAARDPASKSDQRSDPAIHSDTKKAQFADANPPDVKKTQPAVQHPKNKQSDEPFDPIKVNGPIFVGWPKPKAALVISGMIEGYIEPCGCAGMDRMKGGMSRRHSLFNSLREQGWPVTGLDVGGLASGFGRQAEIKFQTMVEGMRKMGYSAIALGASELRLPAGELAAVAANVNDQRSPFVSANVGLFGFDTGMTSTYRIVNLGGKRIGATSILGKTYQKDVHNADIEMIDPAAAIKKVLPNMKGKTDYLVLLANATKDEALSLAKQFPEFNAVVTSDSQPEPPDKKQYVPGTKTLYIEVGHKGMDAIVLGLYDDPREPVRYQSVPLDSRFKASPEMKALMAAYQDQLKALGFAGLGLRPVPNSQIQTNGKFIGSAQCEPCHEDSYKIWKKSTHSHAYKTLVDLDPPRNFDPECVSCHVMGWHPTQFFPYEGGYESLERTPKLIDVGCESCHGPGEKHLAAESGSNEALMEKYRKAVRLTKAESQKTFCVTCHDGDNSPEFQFETYWPLVKHYETTPDPDAATGGTGGEGQQAEEK